jgi:hypothetical protein
MQLAPDRWDSPLQQKEEMEGKENEEGRQFGL